MSIEVVDPFKFAIGSYVDVMCGWEAPIVTNCKVINRKRILKGVGSDIRYENEYLVDKPGAAVGTHVYMEHDIRQARTLKPVEEIF